MTLHVTVNPPNADELYLESLNLCFGHWGDEAMFDWAFRRTAGSHATDRMVLRDDHGELLAGSAVSYRRVAGLGRQFDVGIMTGSWTLPAARGQGCFTRIIEESRLLSEAHGCGLLLAFVTWDNASRRRLEDAGSRMIPSRYVFTADDQSVAATLDVQPIEVDDERLWRRIGASRAGALAFDYPMVEDFLGQCVNRPNPVVTLRVGRATVVVEKAAGTDRISVMDLAGESIQDVYGSVAATAHAAGRRFFGFTMGEPEFAGLTAKHGFLTALVADESALGGAALDELAPWHIDSGDRM